MAESKPPWGSDEEFNAQKAWDLIQNLRAEVKSEKDGHAATKTKLTTAETELVSATKKITDAENSGKSDSEKLAGQLADLEKKLVDSDSRALRAEVVAAKGLSPAQAKRLSGGTREELEADADELLEAFPTPSGPGAPPSRQPRSGAPSGHLGGGGDPTEEAEEKVDPAKLADAIPLP